MTAAATKLTEHVESLTHVFTHTLAHSCLKRKAKASAQTSSLLSLSSLSNEVGATEKSMVHSPCHGESKKMDLAKQTNSNVVPRVVLSSTGKENQGVQRTHFFVETRSFVCM